MQFRAAACVTCALAGLLDQGGYVIAGEVLETLKALRLLVLVKRLCAASSRPTATPSPVRRQAARCELEAKDFGKLKARKRRAPATI
jgi:hypothetical protein